jgi:hypothetical protein
MLEYSKKLWDARVELYKDIFTALVKMQGLQGGWTIRQDPRIMPENLSDMGVDFDGLRKRSGILASDDVVTLWEATSSQFQLVIFRAKDLNERFKEHKGETPAEYKAIDQYSWQFKLGHELLVRAMRAELGGSRMSRSDRKRIEEARSSAHLSRVHSWPSEVEFPDLV